MGALASSFLEYIKVANFSKFFQNLKKNGYGKSVLLYEGVIKDTLNQKKEFSMKNKIKKLSCICLASILMCLGMIVPICADESENGTSSVSPRYAHCSDCIITFAVSDPDIASVAVQYYAYSATFREAKITVQIQKRFLGLFWKTVDIGYSDNKWVAYCYDTIGYFNNSFAVDGSGTYRANITVEIKGSDGTVDVIEKTVEKKYS